MEINLRRQAREECEGGGQTQSYDDRENIEIGSQLQGTTSRTVPHLKEEMDRMKRVMEEMKENMRRANPIEDLVHKTDSPFTASVNGHPLPPKFNMPSLDSTGQSSKSKKVYLKVVQSVQLSRRSPRTKSTNEQAITFIDEDAERIHHPHDDAIVITLLIADYTTRRVLVDNGSSIDILYYPAFQLMKLGRDQLRPMNSPLVGFGGMKV